MSRLVLWIDGAEYNVTDFDHPGGDIIWDYNGRDATAAFYTTHQPQVWKRLSELGKGKPTGGQFSDVFYMDCKEALGEFLADRRKTVSRRADQGIAALWAASWYLLAYTSYVQMLRTACCAAWSCTTGVIWATMLFNVMHPSMHGGLCNAQPWKTVNDLTYTLFSASSCPRWLDRHNGAHHCSVNTKSDTDRHTMPLLRLHPYSQQRRWWHAWQAVYFPLLAALNTVTHQITHPLYMLRMIQTERGVDDGVFRVARHVQFWAAYAVWVCLVYGGPVALCGWSDGLRGSALLQTCGSLVATYNIVVNHTFEGAGMIRDRAHRNWARNSVEASCNHHAGSLVATYLTGGLNHQIEHHLFPSLPVHLLPAIAPRIAAVCKKHNVVYRSMSYPALVASCHRQLDCFGNKE